MFIPLAEPLPRELAAAAVWGQRGTGTRGGGEREGAGARAKGTEGCRPRGAQQQLNLVTSSFPAPLFPALSDPPPPHTVGSYFQVCLMSIRNNL